MFVQALLGPLLDRKHCLARCSTLGAKLVGDDTLLRQEPLLAHQPGQKRLAAASPVTTGILRAIAVTAPR